ncbi:MAG: ribulose-phosphate 3-epimerase [Acidobacteriota bacterium]|nr:ribulose-phosphate 3-epimerase [Acidobacteriota bacterium]MDQ2978573.1 ribulose-phosphate 3-epimerase [Acidobacteriota bacterium]
MTLRIAPSLLAADFARLADALAIAEAGGADLVHVDVMDGRFVPNLTFGPPVVAAVKRATRLPLDVHLMIEEPELTLDRYLDAGADWISVHVEATRHLSRCLQAIRRGGAKAGAVLNPATPLDALEESWPDLDYAVVMSVNPGRGGQPFLRASIDKVRRLRQNALEAGCRASIEVDGGVDAGNAGDLVAAGAEILVAGTSVYGQADPRAAIGMLRAAARGGVRV